MSDLSPMPARAAPSGRLDPRQAVAVFLAFAFAYFFSALVRAVTATLSPTFTETFGLQARDLGLLAGGYFLGFAALQLPLGRWLDAHGPKRVILGFLSVAVVGCVAFALARDFTGLLAARILCGAGVAACLMAPLTGYRRWLSPQAQLRANSWMLMTGSLGMVASTLPVQWLMPWIGWRGLFWALAALVVLAMAWLAWQVPVWERARPDPGAPAVAPGYRAVWTHPYFRRMTPIGFFSYGGLVAMQTLWAGPWMVQVEGRSPLQAATGLFWINLSMLVTFWAWGLLTPRLMAGGWGADRLIARGLPLSFVAMGAILALAGQAGAGSPLLWALFCMSCTFVSLAQPAVGMAFPAALAGRALSAYNLVIFAGVFVLQWLVGLLVDGFKALGADTRLAFQSALGVYLLASILSYGHFLWAGRWARADTLPP